MPTKIYDPTPLIDNDIVEIAKSSIDEVTNRLNLRLKEISIQITCFKKDSETETVEPIEIEVSR